MRHVQRLGNQGRRRTIAGSLALVSGLALFSVARAPLAVGQLASVTVGNSGSSVASTGGNTATGNNSTNSIGGPGVTTGGLIDADVGLGSPTNTSTGTATITSGAANASGNESQTGVNQATTGGSGPGFNPFNPFAAPQANNQSVTVTNDGLSAATTGGNTATGNNSTNSIGGPDGDGAVDALVALGAPTNTSSGTATITSGPANATGNTANNTVNQANIGNSGLGGGGFGSGAGGGGAGAAPAGFFNATPFFPGAFPGTVNNLGNSFDPCSGRFFPFNPFFNTPSGQRVTVNNDGDAVASTGNNTAIGNNSTNTQVINQTASGGLIGLNVNLGSPTNNSTGTATINTGPANASGNQSSTTVNQICGELAAGGGSGSGSQPMIRNPITGNPIVVPSIPTPVVVTPQTGTLARTGFESGLALLATALVLAGIGLLVTARRRLTPVRAGGVSSREWDSIVRW